MGKARGKEEEKVTSHGYLFCERVLRKLMESVLQVVGSI